jgi:signal transduction histidine kinase
VIKIQDTGIGIPKKDRVKLDKFFSKGTSSKGIDLGLIISKNIIEQFNGKISVKSKKNKGSTFMFSMLLGNDEDKTASFQNRSHTISYVSADQEVKYKMQEEIDVIMKDVSN